MPASDDERREVGARRQVFGELETGARRRGVGVDAVVEHAEAVLFAQSFVLAAHVGDFAHFERQPQRVERRPPDFALRQHVAEKRKAVRLFGAARGALIGDIGRRGGALEQELLLVVVGRADLHDGARQAEPRGAVVRRRRDDLSKQRHAAAEVVLRESGVGIAPDLRQRFGRRAGIRLDLRFERDRGIGEVTVLEGLFGGLRGIDDHGRKEQQRGGNTGANERKHRWDPPEGRAISPANYIVIGGKDRVEVVTERVWAS